MRRGRRRRNGRRNWGNVSVAYVIVWLCVLIVSSSGCCLIVGSLWNVSVCFLSVCVGCLGGCLVLLTITVYLLCSSVRFFSRIFFNILFNYLLVWTVACGMHRYVCYRCVPGAWEIASFCLHSLSIFSSRLFSSFLVYSLISYSNIFEYGRLLVECVGMFEYGRLPVECVGMFFIGVCRALGRLPRFAYNHCLSSLLVCSLLFSYIL